ncbi:MAG: hypothetical protein AAF270_05330 [Pseudomonadota bacterium]
MSTSHRAGVPLLIFVPGMKPKPEPQLHRDALWRCLHEGLRRVDTSVANDLAIHREQFTRANWTWVFYRQYRDIATDLPGIEQMLAQSAPDERDRVEATSLRTRLTRALYLAADTLPFLINSFAGDDMQVTLRDVHRYVTNRGGIGDEVRADLKDKLRDAHRAGQPVMLIGHSLGSVIAWDTLWELAHEGQGEIGIDMFMTLGSPLGNKVIQRGIKGASLRGRDRYPDNIRRWVNMVAMGELTALDRCMRNDFREMESLGLVDSIEDYDVYNHYRENGRLLVHSEYGYLVNQTTAGIIADWWRQNCPHLDVRAVDRG